MEEKLNELPPLTKKLSVAVMGCVVNGPGEAREADFGIAGGKGLMSLFATHPSLEERIAALSGQR